MNGTQLHQEPSVDKHVAHLRTAMFRNITLRRVVILYRRFGQPIGHIFNGQEVQEITGSTLVRGAGSLSRNLGVLQVLRLLQTIKFHYLVQTARRLYLS